MGSAVVIRNPRPQLFPLPAGLLRLSELPTKRLQLAIERLPFRTPPPHPFQQFLEFCAVPPPRAVNLRSQFVK